MEDCATWTSSYACTTGSSSCLAVRHVNYSSAVNTLTEDFMDEYIEVLKGNLRSLYPGHVYQPKANVLAGKDNQENYQSSIFTIKVNRFI